MNQDRKKKTLPLPVICFLALVAVLAWCGLHPDTQTTMECRPAGATMRS